MTVPARTASTVTVITGCAAWAALRREPCPIAGDYPERYVVLETVRRLGQSAFRGVEHLEHRVPVSNSCEIRQRATHLDRNVRPPPIGSPP